jgi:hypothetical protein
MATLLPCRHQSSCFTSLEKAVVFKRESSLLETDGGLSENEVSNGVYKYRHVMLI